MVAGLTFALGNVVFGINISQHGFHGATFTTPITLFVAVCYRCVAACRTRRQTGMWLDKVNSNYWRVVEEAVPLNSVEPYATSTDDEFLATATQTSTEP